MTVHPGQWRLDHMEVVNWGTFHGHHVIDVARKGFLLTGHSGSGKSSLVDAITAVLTPRGKTRFNAAAADGSSRAQDRTVVSYVRGAWRRAADEDTGEIATQFLRAGATWSGIALRYGNGRVGKDGVATAVTLIKLFHVKRGASTPGDVQDLHLLVHGRLGLLELKEYAQAGLDQRAIKRRWPDVDVQSEHSRFVAKFSRALGIPGDQAILLLHRTQSAKNLGSLDELFRTFMLDEPSTFTTAERAVEQFTELSQAHDTVVAARQQIEHLTPLAALSQTYDDAGSTSSQAAELDAALNDFTLVWKLELARTAHAAAADAVAVAEEVEREAREVSAQSDLRVREAQSLVDEHGGAQLEAVAARVDLARQELRAASGENARLERDLASVRIPMPTSFEELRELLRTAADLVSAAEEDAHEAEGAVRQAHRERAQAEEEHRAVTAELRSLRGVRSNVGRRLIEARTTIAQATGLPVASLPYVAELVQVRPQFADWTGAVERVLRPLALVMLVPAAHEVAVSAAVDAHHLGAHLKVEVVANVVDPPRRPASEASLVYRVDVAEHPLAPWVHAELARRFDYLCVETPAELTSAEQAVTRAGQVKRGQRSYEKDDRFAVDDRTRWVLGFDNAAKVDHYLGLLKSAKSALDEIDARLGALERARRDHEARVRVLGSLADVQWAAIDVEARQRALAAQEQARADLLAADGDLRRAQRGLNEAESERERLRAAERSAADAAAAARATLAQLATVIAESQAVHASTVPPSVAARLETEFYEVKASRQVTHQSIDADSRKVAQRLNAIQQEAAREQNAAEIKIVSLTDAFIRRWPALASDLTASIEDRGGFLAVLGTLRADRLPDFEQRFFDLLREQSQQNVGILANDIRRAPAEIRRRVDPINSSLRRSEFSPGRFLQIQVDEARPAVAAEFLKDLNQITSGALAGEEDRADAEARFAVLSRVMRQLASSEAADRSWRQACLDTRRHVRFVGREEDEAGDVVDVYDSGDGRSGGQKQKLVVFCLAAALRYQLTRDTSDVPAYGSVVMDEAFDKADSSFTRMALDIFREFGFHMILATPLKLLQTLEDYVDGIALVTCTDSKDSRIAVVPFDAARDRVAGDVLDGDVLDGDVAGPGDEVPFELDLGLP